MMIPKHQNSAAVVCAVQSVLSATLNQSSKSVVTVTTAVA